MTDPRVIAAEQARARTLQVAALIGLAGAGLMAAGAAFLWQWVATPEVRALVWPVFAITTFFGLAAGAVGALVQAFLGFLFSRESDRKVAELVREARGETKRET